MQEVVLVRHGETEWSRELEATGRTDVPLTEEGERQARGLAEPLHGREFALVLSSPLRRAVETARLAGFEPELRDELMEWDYGDYEGRRTAEIREEIPDWTIWRYGAANGESPEEVAARANRVIAEIRAVDGDVACLRPRPPAARACGALARAGREGRTPPRARRGHAQRARLRAGAAGHPQLERGVVSRDSEDILTDPPPPPADARLAYGPEPLQFGDLRLPEGAGPPLAVVLHGGYWKATYNLIHTGHMCVA